MNSMNSPSSTSNLLVTPLATPRIREEVKTEATVIDFSEIDGSEFSDGSIDFANVITRDRRNARLGSKTSMSSIVSNAKKRKSRRPAQKSKHSKTPSRTSLMVPPTNLMLGRERGASDAISTMSSTTNFYRDISIYSEENSLYLPREVNDPVFTAQAPLEIISFFFQVGREGREVSKSTREKDLPEDTLIPDSGLGFTATFESIQYDASEGTQISHRSNPSLSSNILTTPRTSNTHQDNSKSRLYELDFEGPDEEKKIDHNECYIMKQSGNSLKLEGIVLQKGSKAQTGGDREQHFHSITRDANEMTNDVKLRDWSCPEKNFLEGAETVASTLETRSPKRGVKKRTRSTDFAWSEANEVTRILVSELRTPKDVGEYLTDEKKEEDSGFIDPFLHLLRGVLDSGRQGKITSRTMMKKKALRDCRRRQKLATLPWKPDSVSSATLIRAATCRERTPPEKSFCRRVSTIEEEESVELALYDESSAGHFRSVQRSIKYV